jgi:hypothetical protein
VPKPLAWRNKLELTSRINSNEAGTASLPQNRAQPCKVPFWHVCSGFLITNNRNLELQV